MHENPYQAPLTSGAKLATASIEGGRRIFWGLVAALLGLVVVALFASVVRNGQLDWRFVAAFGMYAALCYWLSRGGWVAKWVFVFLMLMQLPLAAVVMLYRPFQPFVDGLLLVEVVIRVAFAAMLVFSRDLNAYLAFRRDLHRKGASLTGQTGPRED